MRFTLGNIVEATTDEGKLIGTITAILIDNEGEEFYYIQGNSSYIHTSLIQIYSGEVNNIKKSNPAKLKKIGGPKVKSD